MVFSTNTGVSDKEAIQTMWDVRGQQQYEKYLDLY